MEAVLPKVANVFVTFTHPVLGLQSGKLKGILFLLGSLFFMKDIRFFFGMYTPLFLDVTILDLRFDSDLNTSLLAEC